MAPVFRAINTPRQRRGIRLEPVYWECLRMLADANGQSIGEAVETALDEAPGATNLASVLRVRIVNWLSAQVGRLESLTHLDSTNAVIQASPAPSFVLTADKRIVLYNRPFLNLIQSRFLSIKADAMQKGLLLSLDSQLDQVIESLGRGNTPMVTSGFVIGVAGQRIRGSVNLALAPVHRQSMVIAFVTSG